MLHVRYWPAAVRGWLLALIAPRYAAVLADYHRARAIADHGRSLAAWQEERGHYDVEYRGENRKRLDAEAQAATLREQLTERTQELDRAKAENEVLRDQLALLIKWREAELQRLETEAHIHAIRRGLPPERNDDEPLQPDR
jgi:dTDP-4-amino-4,6-dideoxygalactose transaminase